MRKFNISNLIFACWELNLRKQLIYLLLRSFSGFGCSSVLVPDTDKIDYKIQLPDNWYWAHVGETYAPPKPEGKSVPSNQM